MTYDEYIQNPMGKQNAVFSQRELFKNLYKDKLDKILVRENGKIEYQLFVDSKSDTYYVYFKIPSEVIKKFYYDVIIQFSSNNALAKGQQTLSGYDVKFFSNDPSFVFTFCHAFVKNDMFVKDFAPKMSTVALKNTGKVRNPKDEVGYVKSIFFAYLYMKQRGLFNKLLYAGAPAYNARHIIGKVMHADEKIRLRQQAQTEFDKKVRDEGKLQQNKKKTKAEDAEHVTNKFETDAVKTVLTSKTIGRSSANKKTKLVRSVKKK